MTRIRRFRFRRLDLIWKSEMFCNQIQNDQDQILQKLKGKSPADNAELLKRDGKTQTT